MQQEEKILTAVMLQAIADQDEKYIHHLKAKPGHKARLSFLTSKDARLFVASEGFAEICEHLNLFTSICRKISPQGAHAALVNLLRDLGETHGRDEEDDAGRSLGLGI